MPRIGRHLELCMRIVPKSMPLNFFPKEFRITFSLPIKNLKLNKGFRQNTGTKKYSNNGIIFNCYRSINGLQTPDTYILRPHKIDRSRDSNVEINVIK